MSRRNYLATALPVALLIPLVGSGPPSLTAQQVVEAKFAAVNRHDIAAVKRFYADNAVVNASDFCAPRRGVGEVDRIYRTIFAAVPDIEADVVELLSQGDRVAARVMLRSRKPGASFDLPLMNFFTVEDGRIVRDEGVFDNAGRPCRK